MEEVFFIQVQIPNSIAKGHMDISVLQPVSRVSNYTGNRIT